MATLSNARAAAWIFVVVSILVVLVFTGIRLPNMLADQPSASTFDSRYAREPFTALMHIVPGVVFIVLAPVQFVTRVRERHPKVHRIA